MSDNPTSLPNIALLLVLQNPAFSTSDIENLRLVCRYFNVICSVIKTRSVIIDFADRHEISGGNLDQSLTEIWITQKLLSKNDIQTRSADNPMRISELDFPQLYKSFEGISVSRMLYARHLVMVVDYPFFNSTLDPGVEFLFSLNSLSSIDSLAPLYPWFLNHLLIHFSNLREIDILVRAQSWNLKTLPLWKSLYDHRIEINMRLELADEKRSLVNSTCSPSDSFDYTGLRDMLTKVSGLESDTLPLKLFAMIPSSRYSSIPTSLQLLKCIRYLDLKLDWDFLARNEPVKPAMNFLGQFENLTCLKLGTIPAEFYKSRFWLPETLREFEVNDTHLSCELVKSNSKRNGRDRPITQDVHTMLNVHTLRVKTKYGRFFQHFSFPSLNVLELEVIHTEKASGALGPQKLYQVMGALHLSHVTFKNAPPEIVRFSVDRSLQRIERRCPTVRLQYTDLSLLGQLCDDIEIQKYACGLDHLEFIHLDVPLLDKDPIVSKALLALRRQAAMSIRKIYITDMILLYHDTEPWANSCIPPGSWIKGFGASESFIISVDLGILQ